MIIINCGKHKGKSILDIMNTHKSYVIKFLAGELNNSAFGTNIKQIAKWLDIDKNLTMDELRNKIIAMDPIK